MHLFDYNKQLKAKISSYNKTFLATKSIKSKLTVKHIHEFKSTCFVHFFNLQKVLHHGQLILLIELSLVECDDKETMEFNFDGTMCGLQKEICNSDDVEI